MMSINMNLQENIKRILREERKLSNFLRRRLEMLDYEVERFNKWGGHNICIFFKSDIEYFETIMENAIDAMYYNYFSHMDDNSGEWAHEYLDMVNYIRENYQNKIMKHYDDNCGSGLSSIKESTFFRRRVDMSLINKEFFENLNIITDVYLKKYNEGINFNFETFEHHLIHYLMDGYHGELSNDDYDNFPYDEVYNFLLNYFHDKIKDRYDTFFGNKINESVDKSEDKKLKLVKDIIYNMFDDIIDLEYHTERNEIMVYYDKQEELESSEICDIINDFTGLNVVPWYVYDKRVELKKEPDFYIDTERYEEEIYENYSPAGKEITPNKIVIHKSNPKFRDKIIEQGLKVRAGECYKIYAGYGTKCKPAIFATNSTNKRAWFDSTYDDDVWEIDTTMMPEIKWYKDRHYESSKKHIVTFQDIPKEAIKLIYEGSGKDGGIMESVDKSEDKKLKLVTKMIHKFFDDVSFIDIKKYENKPMITVYFDNYEYAGNEETYFAEQIQSKIYEYTGIKLIPYWHTIQYNTDADFRLDAIKLKYDNEGNVINESEDKLNILLNRHFDEVFDNLTLVIDNGGYCRWFFNDEDIPEDDHDDDSVFSKNLAGTLWVQNCDEFRKLVDVRTYLSLSAHEIKIKLMRYINNRYEEQFLEGFFGKDGFVKIVDSHHCVDLYGLLP